MDEYPQINRYGVVLLPTIEFLAWLKSSPVGESDYTMETVLREPTVVLIHQCEFLPNDWIKDHWRQIAESLFGDWCTDPTTWPQDISEKSITKYVTPMFTSVIHDMCDSPLEREEWD